MSENRPSYEDIMAACARASFGDLDVRVPVPEEENEDPLCDLAEAFNILMDDLQLRSDEAARLAKTRAEQLERMVQQRTMQLEQAKEAAEAGATSKSAFLAIMSHEIRTPLNAVLGFAGLLADTKLDATQQEFVQSIRSSGDHLVEVINDILDYSKLASGHFELEYVPMNLLKTIEDALYFVAKAAADKDVELVYVIEDDVPGGMRADEARIRQTLVNLLSNAVKFTSEGEVVVRVSARPLKAPRTQVSDQPWFSFDFSVEDSGIGIAEEHRERLFEEFSQADSSTARRFGGTGLGLSISKSLVELHGGRIWAEGAADQGSIFRFTIPALASPEFELPGVAHGQTFLQGRKALIVDDNATSLEVLRRLAERWGMDVQATQDSREALERIQSGEPYELIMLDHHMPGLDGVDLASLAHDIRASDPPQLVLLSSLNTSVRYAQDGEQLFAAILPKPLRQSELFDIVSDLFNSAGRASRLTQHEPFEPLPSLSVLMAEDTLINQRVGVMILRKLGLTADVVNNGLEVLEALKSKAYDVILMDVQMPEMDGLEATRRIRALGDSIRQPRIIALTANAMRDDYATCLDAGMDAYVSKPVNVEALRHQISLTESEPAADVQPSAALVHDGCEFSELEVGIRDQLDEEDYLGLLEVISLSMPSMIEQLRTAMNNQDVAALRRTAHMLKSSVGYVGKPDLAAQLDSVEKRALTDGLSEVVSEVPDMLERLEGFVEQVTQLHKKLLH